MEKLQGAFVDTKRVKMNVKSGKMNKIGIFVLYKSK
jgi:hypothetical protein